MNRSWKEKRQIITKGITNRRKLPEEGGVFSHLNMVKARAVMKEWELMKEAIEVADWAWMVIDDKDGIPRYVRTNRRVKELLGYEPEEVIGMSIYDFMVPEDRESVEALYREAVLKGESFNKFINRNVNKVTKEIVYLETSGRPLLDKNGKVVGYVGVDRDVTDRIKAEKQNQILMDELMKLSVTDHLTGAYNRRFVETVAMKCVASRKSTPLSVLLIDVDRFKIINDNFGHPIGDQVLIKIAEKIRSVLREEDIFGRMGGDEFAILLDDTDYMVRDLIIQRIEKAVNLIEVEGLELPVTVSIGRVTIRSRIGQNWESVYAEVDKDLYERKPKIK